MYKVEKRAKACPYLGAAIWSFIIIVFTFLLKYNLYVRIPVKNFTIPILYAVVYVLIESTFKQFVLVCECVMKYGFQPQCFVMQMYVCLNIVYVRVRACQGNENESIVTRIASLIFDLFLLHLFV